MASEFAGVHHATYSQGTYRTITRAASMTIGAGIALAPLEGYGYCHKAIAGGVPAALPNREYGAGSRCAHQCGLLYVSVGEGGQTGLQFCVSTLLPAKPIQSALCHCVKCLRSVHEQLYPNKIETDLNRNAKLMFLAKHWFAPVQNLSRAPPHHYGNTSKVPGASVPPAPL